MHILTLTSTKSFLLLVVLCFVLLFTFRCFCSLLAHSLVLGLELLELGSWHHLRVLSESSLSWVCHHCVHSKWHLWELLMLLGLLSSLNSSKLLLLLLEHELLDPLLLHHDLLEKHLLILWAQWLHLYSWGCHWWESQISSSWHLMLLWCLLLLSHWQLLGSLLLLGWMGGCRMEFLNWVAWLLNLLGWLLLLWGCN